LKRKCSVHMGWQRMNKAGELFR